MPLLHDADYDRLKDRNLRFEEDAAQRFFIFLNWALPDGTYQVESCEALVIIPANYNQDGNDMFWTFPRLVRRDGQQIPNTGEPGADGRVYGGKQFCRWSRHWPQGAQGSWRAGRDDIISIHRRVQWALTHPDNK